LPRRYAPRNDEQVDFTAMATIAMNVKSLSFRTSPQTGEVSKHRAIHPLQGRIATMFARGDSD